MISQLPTNADPHGWDNEHSPSTHTLKGQVQELQSWGFPRSDLSQVNPSDAFTASCPEQCQHPLMIKQIWGLIWKEKSVAASTVMQVEGDELEKDFVFMRKTSAEDWGSFKDFPQSVHPEIRRCFTTILAVCALPALWERPGQTETPCCAPTLLLYFSDVPDPPEDLQLSENQNRSVRLSWKAGATHNSPVNGRKGFPASLLGLFRILARVGCHRTQTLLTDWITLTTPVRLL